MPKGIGKGSEYPSRGLGGSLATATQLVRLAIMLTGLAVRGNITAMTTTTLKSTDKQITYTLTLLGKAGYSTRYMDASFKALGATMRERTGTVEAWLRTMPRHEISALIGRLS